MAITGSDHKVCILLALGGETCKSGSGRRKNPYDKDSYCRGIKYCKKCDYHIKTKILRCECCTHLFRTKHRQKKGEPFHICSLRASKKMVKK